MAQLKDLLVNGSARVIGSLFANLSGNVLNFGVCSTAAATAAKTVTTNGTFELITGSKILVLFSETDSSNAPTLNVNGTGAKSIKINASDGIGKGFLVAQQYYWFVYDGTNWRTAGAGITQIIPTQYGGTGNSSYTANRPLFYNGTRIIGSTTNYINDTQLAINKTSITSGYNFEVNGNSNLIGSVTVGTSTSGALGIAQTDGAGRGISLYNGPASAMPDYGIAFAKTATFGTHGAVTSDWATYFTMSNTTTRGWIFRRGSTNVASIDGTGKLYLGYAASAANPGIYWNPYVESASDGSDVSAIYQIKSGVAGGTELRISQANDATDVINIVSPQFIYLNSKKTFRINDAWLRINEDKGFSSGIYTGSSLVRTDNQFQVGDSGNKFYANSSGNGYFSNTLGIGGTNTSYKLYVNGTSLHTNTININPNTVAIDFRYNGNSYHSTISYQTYGNEALVFANKYPYASFLFITNEDSVTNHGYNRWQSLTNTGLQIKENSVQIGGLWGHDVHPDYKFKVNGTSYFTDFIRIPNNKSLIQDQESTSNYTSIIQWRKGGGAGQSGFTYNPQVGQHNTGGADGSGSICVLPYATSTDPWGGSVGLYICRGQAKLDGHRLLTSHYAAIDSGVKLTSGYSWISIAGTSSFTCPDGTAITQPDGANPMVLYSGAASARDCGIFYLSNNNAYVANSSDNAYTFGVFDTDITQNFSTEGNASLCVRSNGVGTFVRSRLGVNGINDSYNLYVNGTAYFNGQVTATQFNGPLNGNATSATKLVYGPVLNSDAAINSFHTANTFQAALWNNTSSPGVSNGIILDIGWTNATYGAQLAIDDDPSYFIALRQRDGNGWKAWKRIPMGDGTGASGTWGININGNAATATNANCLYPQGIITAISGTSRYPTGLRFGRVYTSGYPFSYGSTITIEDGAFGAELIFNGLGGGGATGTGAMYFRTHSDWSTSEWGQWKRLWAQGDAVTGAVWNDYAEYREADTIQGGRCVREIGDDTLSLTTKRLMRGCSITSDTWGFAQGETEKAKTPIAVAGRVLAYPLEDRELFKEYIGYSVCSGPDGTVSLMTEEEELKYPWAIVGTVSAVPDYEEWGGGEMADRPSVKVDGRIWIKVR